MSTPEVIEQCARCEHAAIYRGEDGEFLCGTHGHKASLFTYPPTAQKVRRAQATADAALARKREGSNDG